MKGLKKSIVGVMLLLVFSAGCVGQSEEPRSSLEQSLPDKTEVKKKHELIFAQNADPLGLDPALVDDAESAKVMSQIYEGLLQYEKDTTKVKPLLAKSYEVSADGLRYRFDLQEGVYFHDGEPFNAEAVKLNIERFLSPEAKEQLPYANIVYGDVASVEAVDEYRVIIHLTRPSSTFLNNMAMSVAAPMASPKAIKEGQLMEHPVGTGPFVFESWNKGEKLTLHANNRYWGSPAAVEQVIFRFIPENSARVLALENKEVDIIDALDPNSAEEAEKIGAKVMTTPGMNINYLAYNTTSPIFQDVAMRKAVSQAINVPELVNSLYKDYAKPADTIVPEFLPGYSYSVKQVSFKPEAAKKALAEAEIKKIRLITYTNSRLYNPIGGMLLAEAIQGYLSQVGVEVEIESYEWSEYKEKLKAADYDLCLYGWNGDNGDSDNFLKLPVTADPTMNVAHYQDDTLAAMLEKARTTGDASLRTEQYVAIEKYLADKAIWLPLSHTDVLTAYRPEVKNYFFHVTSNIFMKEMYVEE